VAEPALQAAIDTLLAKLEAITPTTDPETPFKRAGIEGQKASTRQARRIYDPDFEGHASERPLGRWSRVARISVRIEYPLGRNERELEAVLAQDSEDIVRALTEDGAWPNQKIVRVVPSTTVNREEVEPVPGEGAGTLALVVAAEITYPDPS
jgi:hypothetical protein